MAKKVYAIKEGFDSVNNKKIENIIVNTWAECLKYVKGVKGAKYKSFESMEEANEFLYNSNDVLKKEDNNYPVDCLHIYVDGSYNIATEQYSYGLVAMKDNVIEYIDGGIGTNDSSRNIRQIAGELDATVKGVEYAKKIGEKKVVIFHDYIGICYHATGFWERKEESSKRYYEKMQNFINSGMEIIFVKVDSPGNSIRRLFELSFHSVAFVLYCAIISSSSIFPNILTYWSIGSERAIFIIWESGCLGSSMLIVSTSLMYDLYHLARFCRRDFLILLTIGIKSSRLVLPSR